MKTLKTILATSVVAAILLLTTKVKAQDNPKISELKIKTSAVCDMCKETIESSIVFEKGIKKSTLDVSTGILTVIYNPQKTSPEKIRIAVSKIGYDADSIPANQKAYDRLHSCCKKK